MTLYDLERRNSLFLHFLPNSIALLAKYVTLVACVSDFLQRSAILKEKRPFCVFEPPLGDLGTTYDYYLRLIGKRVGDFLLVLIELFSLVVMAEALRAKIDRKSAISL